MADGERRPMRTGSIAGIMLLLALMLSACGTEQAQTGAGGLTDMQRIVGERVAGAASTAYLLAQIAAPALSAIQGTQAKVSSEEAPLLRELLESALGKGAVQVDREPGSLTYSVTVTHGSILAGLVPVSGTLTSSAELADPLLISVNSQGITVGRTSVSGAVGLSLPLTDPALGITAEHVRLTQDGQDTACQFDLVATVTPKTLGAVALNGTLVVTAEGVPDVGTIQVSVVAEDLTARVASPYPANGTVTFVCDGHELRVAFDGSRWATLSDGAGHWIAVPLPALT